MTIKIQCPCGVKYALDITADHLTNPIRFVCQQCGTDDSAAINEIIRQQFAAEAPQPKAAPKRVEVHPAPTAPVCLHHGDQPAVSNCLVCKKPICLECMRVFGYVCSAYCAGQAERAGVTLPVYEHQKSVVEARFWKKVRAVFAAVLVLLALLAVAAMWYNFVGSRPKPAYTVKMPDKRNDGFCKFVSDDQVVIRHGNRLSRYDLKQKRELWFANLLDPQQIEEAAAVWVDQQQFRMANWELRRARLKAEGNLLFDNDKDEEAPKSEAEMLADAREMIEDSLLGQLRFHFDKSDIWVAYSNKVAHFDAKTGNMDKEIPIPGTLERFVPTEDSLLALSEAPLGEKILTHIRLPGGEAQTVSLKPEPVRSTNLAKIKLPALELPWRAASLHFRPDIVDGEADRYLNSAIGTYLLNAGPNVAEVKVSMIEEKIVRHETMKAQPAKSVLEGDLNVTKTADVANEVFNEMARERTGGVRFEDESRYLVTLRRKLATGAVPDWTGEVTGPPQLFPLKTVDVLVAGKGMIVLDKNNQKRWETKLNYTVSPQMMVDRDMWNSEDSERFMPCVERSSTLFFFDQGVLAAFDVVTGNARWRLPSVGVTSLKFDDKGMMYVITTSAQQQDIKYLDQIDVNRKTVPVIMKVDPKIGKIIWSLNQTGETCLFSGKYFYAIEASTGGGTRFGRDVPAHTRIYRLHPRDGRVIWDHLEKQFPVDIDFRDNTILALFPDELKVLKFMAL